MARRSHKNGSERGRADQGFILVLTALLILPLIAFVGFATDLGAWYGRAAKIQRAADAAALAGVTWLPNDAKAKSVAIGVAAQNGFTNGGDISVVAEPVPGSTNKMRVTIKDTKVDQYFSQVFSGSAVSIERTGTAEFQKAVPLGSPVNTFGGAPTGDPATCQAKDKWGNPIGATTCNGVWGAINGPFTSHSQGDPYATTCAGNNSSNLNDVPPANCYNNADYKPEGYMYALDVPQSLVGVPITVEIFDAVASTGGNNLVGDTISSKKFNTQFTLYDSDGSDATIQTTAALRFNSAKCTSGPGSFIVSSDSSTDRSNYKAKWVTLCKFTPTKAGIHPLVVKSSNITNYLDGSAVTDSGGGLNSFSIRASRTPANSTQPTVYAVQDMSVYTPTANIPGNKSLFYLANIDATNAGRTLIIDLFDPGDGGGNSPFTMQFRPPPSGLGFIPLETGQTPISCEYNATGSSTFGPATPNTSSNCTITTKTSSQDGSLYNDKWLRVKINIPDTYGIVNTYGCKGSTPDCWWSVKYDYGSSGNSTDRTVWTVSLSGKPVRLIENEG